MQTCRQYSQPAAAACAAVAAAALRRRIGLPKGASGIAAYHMGTKGPYKMVSVEDQEEGRGQQDQEVVSWSALCQELGKGLALAGPTVIIQLLFMFSWTLTTSMVGSQLGVDALAGVSLANLAGNLTGVSIIYGTLSAMDTLAPRAVGTGQYRQLGLLAQRAAVLCVILLVPVCVAWLNIEALLMAVGQPPAACALAGQFLRIYILSLPPLVGLEVCRRFCIVQEIVNIFILNAVLMLAVHALCLWIGLPRFGFIAAPIAHVLSQTTGFAVAVLYLRCASPHHPDSWYGFDLRNAMAPTALLRYAKLGLPGIASMGEWWFWESIAFMAGELGELQLATHTIGYAMIPLAFMVPLAVSIAVSARIGLLLSAQRVAMARALTRLIQTLFLLVCAAYSAGFYHARHWIISGFTSDAEVIARSDALWPWVVSFIFFDGIMGVQQGFLRALGLQQRMMWVFFGWLWLVGLPAAFLIAFESHGLLPTWCTAIEIASLEPSGAGTVSGAVAGGGGSGSGAGRDAVTAGGGAFAESMSGDVQEGDRALCGLWQMMTPLYIVLDALLIAAYMSKDWNGVSRSIYDEAEEAKAAATTGMCAELPMSKVGSKQREADYEYSTEV
eukprot:COSAG05_NODE_305_length_11703_cov_15.056705_1_plen_613_part_00